MSRLYWSELPRIDPSNGYVARSDFPSVLLDGGVFVTAGSSEFLDLTQNQWTARASPSGLGSTLTATALHDGRVLVRGSTSASVYNPIANTWTPTGALPRTGNNFTTTLLPNGHVLACGGGIGATNNGVEIYDPLTNQWTPSTPLVQGRFDHVSVMLPTGRVLVIGGDSGAHAHLPAA